MRLVDYTCKGYWLARNIMTFFHVKLCFSFSARRIWRSEKSRNLYDRYSLQSWNLWWTCLEASFTDYTRRIHHRTLNEEKSLNYLAKLQFGFYKSRKRRNPEQLTGRQLAKKFPPFYETPRFITTFTRARHLSLSWSRSIQSVFGVYKV